MSYKLQPNDLLCFMHIPKTAGLSLISLLDAQFDKSEIFPFHSIRKKPTPRWLWLIPLRMNRYRLLRGHYQVLCPQNTVRRAMPVEPVVVTMLREPFARTVSAYRHLIRQGEIPKQTTLSGYLNSPEHQHRLVNAQTRWLSGIHMRPHDDKQRYSDKQLLEQAKHNLERITFFGIVEHFNESIQLMHAHFGWEQPAELPQENRAPTPFDLSTLTDQEHEALHQRITLDLELYTYAQDLFRQRYPSVSATSHA